MFFDHGPWFMVNREIKENFTNIKGGPTVEVMSHFSGFSELEIWPWNGTGFWCIDLRNGRVLSGGLSGLNFSLLILTTSVSSTVWVTVSVRFSTDQKGKSVVSSQKSYIYRCPSGSSVISIFFLQNKT